jgi:succinyldiaminopimelate transaminase
VSQYPTTTGLPELRAAIADYIGRRFDVSIDPSTQVLPTSGAKEAVFTAPLAFVERNGRRTTVVYPSPGYPIYERGARFAGAAIYPVVLRDDFVMRRADVEDDVWSRTGLVWINSPHNPSGSVMSRDEIAELVDQTRDVGALLFSDECYTDIYEPSVYPSGPASALEVAGAGAEGVVAFLSCSKRSGMTGYRSGAMVGDAAAIAALTRLRTATGTASPEFVQSAAIAAWSDDEHAVARRDIFSDKRAVLRKAFADLGYRTVASDAALYLWIEVDDDVAVADRLLSSGIVVSPGRFFGAGGEGYIRLALVPPLAECEAAVEALRKALA